MSNISWSMTAQVSGGPKLSLSKTFVVDAHDESDSDIETENITYSVNESTAKIKLDAPQVFLGEGAVSLLS